MVDKKNWLQLLAYVTGSINQELLLRNEYHGNGRFLLCLEPSAQFIHLAIEVLFREFSLT